MNGYVPRTCTEVAQRYRDNPAERPKPKPLREFRDSPAIVLLGAPGAGKTEMFKREAKLQTEAHEGQGETRKAGCYVTARNFVTFDERSEWHETTLFIDGLDEMRAGASDQRTPFDRIRAKLDKLGKPPFRLSCREADWFGATDRAHLESVSSDGNVLVLRLDPLSKEGIRELLSTRQGIEDIEEFISNTRHKGIGALLENPQTLGMLADAVASGNWPESRTQTFELACLKLLSEQNPEHQLGRTQSQYSDADLLDAAGRLCALLLLSGRAGCRATADQADVDSILLPEISKPSQEILNRTIHTKLFTAEDGLAAPIHRHIAEFLAGRHLADLIKDGLPVRRILALIAGEDGGLVSELRGLSAWTAAHSKMGRSELIERDPEGVVLYGNAKQFSVDEKRRILDCLEREAERDPWSIADNQELDARWGDLATPDMRESFAELLTSEPTNDARQSVVNAALTALSYERFLPSLQPTLMHLARDQAGWFGTRELALDAYIEQAGKDKQFNQVLQDLLDAVHSGAVSDPDDQLLGRLLRHLYPNELSPSNIGRYFRAPKDEDLLGEYLFFWRIHFMNNTTEPVQMAEALDSFAQFCGNSSHINQSHQPPSPVREFPILLLSIYLKHPDVKGEIDTKRLFSWLQISANISGNEGSSREVQEVRDWFSTHPEQYKAIFKMAAGRSVPFFMMGDFLFHAAPPRDFASWCIDQSLKEKDRHLARKYLDEAMRHFNADQQGNGLSRKALKIRMAERPDLWNRYEELLTYQQQGRDHQKQRERQVSEKQRKAAEEHRKRSEQWRNAVKSHEGELRENCAPPMLLHKLADVYFRPFSDIDGNTGQERLLSLLGGDEHLVDLVLNAFRESTRRSDLPEAPDILRLAGQNKRHLLALPFVVGLGLHELGGNLQAGKQPLDEEGMRLALAICFGRRLLNPNHGAWYDSIVRNRPDLAAEILVQAFRISVRNGKDSCAALQVLGRGSNHDAEIARRAVPQLARIFPVPCKAKQLGMLKHILLAALRHCEQNALLEMIEAKLTLKSLNVGQRIYWLASGMLASPASFTKRLASALSGRGKEQRVRHLANFSASETHGKPTNAIAMLDVAAKETLIRFIGACYRPDAWRLEDGPVGNEELAAKLVRQLMHQISSNPSPEASDALGQLSKDPLLKPWHPHIRHAAHLQREVRRAACFIHATPKQVQQTLDNIRPANSADLAALVTDHLVQLAKNIRQGETSDWRQYWNTDASKHPQEPKHEELCRDALLSDLQPRLAPLGIHAHPEGQCANDKRADIRICYEGLNLPIEIKKNSHRDLWTTMRSQLIGQYAQDPGAKGYGIYLVFWFGAEGTLASPQGVRPNTAGELEKCLCATLPNAYVQKISVLAMDVSRP